MAMTDANGAGVWNGLSGLFGDVKELAIDYTRAKYINAETVNDDRNVPDEADLRAGVAQQAASDATGGTFASSVAGVPVAKVLIVAGAGIATLVILKKTGVF